MLNQKLDENLEHIRDSAREITEANDRRASAWIPEPVRGFPSSSIRVQEDCPVLVARLEDLDKYSLKAKPKDLLALMAILDKVFQHLCQSLGVLKVRNKRKLPGWPETEDKNSSPQNKDPVIMLLHITATGSPGSIELA